MGVRTCLHPPSVQRHPYLKRSGGREIGAGETAPPGHLIRPDDFADWLADSVVRLVTYHRASRDAAHEIIARGVDISRSRIGSYGQGFYTATAADEFAGDSEVVVAIRTVRPLIGDAEAIGAQVDDLVEHIAGHGARITPAVAAEVRRAFLGMGYDGIVVRDAGGDGIDYVIALLEHTVKVVRP